MKRNRAFLASILLAASTFGACDAAGQAAPNGEALFKAHCATCHQTVPAAANPAPSPTVLAAKSQEEILRALESGTMVIYGNRMVEAERRAIAAFLSSNTDSSAADFQASLCATRKSITPAGLSQAENWNGWGVDVVNSRFQPHTSIRPENISQLKLKWAFGVPDASTAYGQPTIVAGRLFIGSGDGRVYALDAATGCTLWSYQAVTTVRTAITVAEGVQGKFLAYFGDGEANLYAVDAEDGKLAWKVRVDPHPLARITGAPKLYRGRLYVSVSSGEELAAGDPDYPCCTFRGSVVAVDALTGTQIWKAYAIAQEPAPSKPGTSHGKFNPAGAGIWSSPAIDEKRGALYVGTGDAYIDPAAEGTDSVIAFDLATGKRLWLQQRTFGDVFNMGCIDPRHLNCPPEVGPDVDFGSSVILENLGKGRRVLVASQKNGVVYGFDPDDGGKQLWQVSVGLGSGLGGVMWGSASDGKNAYVGNSDIATLVRYGPPGTPPPPAGGLAAVELRTGKLVWKTMPPKPACEGKPGCSAGQLAAVTAVPGVVFSGSMDGHLRAYSAADGKIIWDFDTTPEFKTVNGVKAHGGSMSGSGPTVSGNMLFVASGFTVTSGTPGNLILAFELAPPPESGH